MIKPAQERDASLIINDQQADYMGPEADNAVYRGPVVDAYVCHEWPSSIALTPYMTGGWAEFVTRPGDRRGPLDLKSKRLYRNPLDDKASDSYTGGGPPGSDYALLKDQLLHRRGRERLVLGYEDGLLSTAFCNYYAARAVARAANEWTLEEWLKRDPRVYGLILVAAALPEEAAAEIRRVGVHEQMVGVALGTNGLGRPFGHPVYHPIYKAASEMNLPLVLETGCDAAADSITVPVAGGLPATCGEYRALSAQALAGHVASMIVNGVFDLFPNLKLLLVGGGATWIPGYIWRFDYWHKTSAHVVPWMHELPSEYFIRHIRVSTYSLESPPKRGRLAAALTTVPGIESMLVYASCYPNADSEEPTSIAARLPEAWHKRVFSENALDFFRWPSKSVGAGADSALERTVNTERQGGPRRTDGTRRSANTMDREV